MHAIDTNVIVRYLTGDDPKQTEKARARIGQAPIFIPKTVLLEAEWVLRAAYGLAPEKIIAALRALAGLPHVTIEDAAVVATAMDWAAEGMDFADALHLAAAAGCTSFLTFDKRFARIATRLGGVQVTAP